MNELYKEHHICSSAKPVSDSMEWKPTVEVSWAEGPMDFMKRWMDYDFTQSCATEKLAEIEAHLFARDWIDSGKTTAPQETKSLSLKPLQQGSYLATSPIDAADPDSVLPAISV